MNKKMEYEKRVLKREIVRLKEEIKKYQLSKNRDIAIQHEIKIGTAVVKLSDAELHKILND